MHREYWLSLLVHNLSFLRNFQFSKSVKYCLRKNIFTLTTRLRDGHQVNRQQLESALFAIAIMKQLDSYSFIIVDLVLVHNVLEHLLLF